MLKSQSMQDIRKKVGEAVDQRVRIITAGMGINELRAVLRGDPPTEKPNPRYRAQVKSFMLHIRPKFYQEGSTWFSHTLRLGLFSTFFLILVSLYSICLTPNSP